MHCETIPPPDVHQTNWLTIAEPTRQLGLFKKQTGGMSYFGLVTIVIEPLADEAKVLVENDVDRDRLPPEYWSAIVEGFIDILRGSPKQPSTLVGMRILVIDGVHHLIDSNPFAFRMAARQALRAALDNVGAIPWLERIKNLSSLPLKRGAAYRADFLKQYEEFARLVGQSLEPAGFKKAPAPLGATFWLRKQADVWQLVTLDWRWHYKFQITLSIMNPAVGQLVTSQTAWHDQWQKYDGTLLKQQINYPPKLNTTISDLQSRGAVLTSIEINEFFAPWPDIAAIIKAVEAEQVVVGTARHAAMYHIIGQPEKALQMIYDKINQLSQETHSGWRVGRLQELEIRLRNYRRE